MTTKNISSDKSTPLLNKRPKEFNTRQGATFADLPPIPIAQKSEWHEPIVETNLTSTSSSSEIALLLDHLSLAKEENREILKLTNAAMAQIKTSNDMVISSKDELIHLLTEKIERLNQYKSSIEEALKKSQSETEDLQILISTVMTK